MSYPNSLLLIDDDHDEQMLFHAALAKLGQPVSFRYEPDCSRAVYKLQTGELAVPDIILLDWNMPRTNASHCLDSIRQVPGCATTPLVIFSGMLSSAISDEAERLGVSLVVRKPWNIDDLAVLLQDIFTSVSHR